MGQIQARNNQSGGVHPENETLYTVGYSNVYLFAIGTSGPNSAPYDLLTSGSGTDSNGNVYVTSSSTGTYSLANDYECPNGTDVDSTPVYIVAKGGTINGTTNAQFTQVVVSPYNCGYLISNPSTILNLSDFTSVAAAFEAAPFSNSKATLLGDGFSTSTSIAANLSAIGAAFTDANSVVSVSTGLYAGSTASVQKQLNTLADISEACNASSGGTTGACANLYTATTQGAFTSGNTPTDPWQAMASIGQYPDDTSNTTAQLNIIGSTPYYSPYDSTVPTGGWVLPVTGAPTIGCTYASGTHGHSITFTGATNLSGTSVSVVVFGQAVTGTLNSPTDTTVTFTIPSHTGLGSLAVYQSGYASNACPFQIM